MEKEFWHQRWQNKDIGFHNSDVHPLLIRYFPSLQLDNNARVFVPLCGKTLDIHWLLEQGYQVCGIELVESAVQELFLELDIQYKVTTVGQLKKYCGDNIVIYVGDIFNLSQVVLGSVHAVYDRAAMVALPESLRDQYITHVSIISEQAKQLLITFEYDTSLMTGPPFSHSQDDVHQYYQHFNHIQLLTRVKLEQGLKGHGATEFVWYLSH